MCKSTVLNNMYKVKKNNHYRYCFSFHVGKKNCAFLFALWNEMKSHPINQLTTFKTVAEAILCFFLHISRWSNKNNRNTEVHLQNRWDARKHLHHVQNWTMSNNLVRLYTIASHTMNAPDVKRIVLRKIA